jgi:hypothetical protein
VVGSAAAGAAVRPAPAAARYVDGPPPGFTGGFGEQSCHACHFSAEPNQGPGRFSIDGFPEKYSGGEVYPLRVRLSRPGMALGGFQLAARFEDGGTQAGTFKEGPGEQERIRVVTDHGIQYVQQLAPGAVPSGPDSSQWIVLWTAPEPNGPVQFHAAANAADGDGSAMGDHVFTLSKGSLPE